MVPLGLGVPLGAAWWFLAPGGGLYGDGAEYASWDERDLVFAGLMLAAGFFVGGALWVSRGRQGIAGRALCTLLGSAAGSVVAWQFGLVLAIVFGAGSADRTETSQAFSLLAMTALAVWPGVVALWSFALTTFLWTPPRR